MERGKIVGGSSFQIEKIERRGFKKTKVRVKFLDKISKAQTFPAWLRAKKEQFRKDNLKNEFKFSSSEVENMLEIVLDSYDNYYEKEIYHKNCKITNKDRKYKEMAEEIHVIKPYETRILARREVEWVSNYLRKFNNKEFRSIQLAILFSDVFNKNIFNREDYLSNRKFQNDWCDLLGYLSSSGEFEYSGGLIRTP